MLGKVTFFSLIRRLRLRLSRHLPPREGFWSAACKKAMRRACFPPSPMRGRRSRRPPLGEGYNKGFPWGKLCAAQPLCDEGMVIAHNLLGKVTFFSLIRRLRLRLSRHLPPGEGFWSAACKKAMRRACVPSPMRGKWREAPDEVVDVNERPLIRLFSLRSKIHPLRHSRIGARRKKPSRLAFFLRLAPRGGGWLPYLKLLFRKRRQPFVNNGGGRGEAREMR